MVDITITAADAGLETGSTGDDAVTFEVTVVGAGIQDGGGGSDAAVFDAAGDTAGVFSTTTFTTATGVWDLAASGTDLLQNGFTSLTTKDGLTLLSDTASSGFIQGDPAATIDPADGSYTATMFTGGSTVSSYDWAATPTGFALTVTPLTTPAYTVVSVDGTAVSGLTTFSSADGAGTITFVGDDDIQFTPNTANLAGVYNVGETVDFTYDVVVEDAFGVQTTIPQTFTVEIAWTGGDDVYVGVDAALAGLTVTDGDNTSTGLAFNDGGDDSITGAGGDDSLYGGAGSDTILGGDGNDSITDGSLGTSTDTNILGGGSGDDYIAGGASGDKLRGGGGQDDIIGGAGDDIIQGGSGDDNGGGFFGGTGLVGGAGNDIIRGGSGDDVIDGTSGSNELRGGTGDDMIIGGTDNDVIYTSLGESDTIDLSAGGSDSIIVKSGTGNTVVTGWGTDDEMDITAFSGFSSAADVMAVSYETATGDLVINFDATTSITLLAGSDGLAPSLDLDNTMFEFA